MAEQQWDEVVRSYLAGSWQEGDGSESFELINPATGETLATGSTGGLDRDAALRWAREKGSPALREMSFAERGEKLRGLAKALHEHRERFIDIAIANGGNTRKDAKFDIDGATGTLQYYGSLAKGLGDQGFLPDGEGIQLGRSARWWGQHILVPRRGVAVHINAFNFPAWGAFEKAAVAWLAGMSVLTKPAPATALLTVEMAKVALESGLLPEGALQVLAGEPGDLLEHVEAQDVVAFTGSSETGAHVRGSTSLVEKGVPVNIEADSLNAAVLGADVERGSEAWHLFVNDVVREITQKAGQKCTAVRRILVPESMLDEVEETLIDRLSSVTVGDPADDAVDMGPLTHDEQKRRVLEGIAALEEAGATRIYGDAAEVALHQSDADVSKGAFVGPTLLRASAPLETTPVHEREVFGPVATVLPYDGTADTAANIVNLAGGGLVTSIYSDDTSFSEELVLRIAPYHGRIYVGDSRCASQAMGSGIVLPMMVHGGPGRAGCGEELGGERGLRLYMQRVGVQGSRRLVSRSFGE